jgi:TnpA family transposase
MPRLKDLPDQVLYRVDRDADYGPIDPLLRNFIDIALIAEQWDQLVRIVASLKDRTPADVVLQRVINASPADRVAKLTALGRLAKTIHILRYINEEPLRRPSISSSIAANSAISSQMAAFANQGIFRTGDYEEIMNKASCLSLLSNAVLVWKCGPHRPHRRSAPGQWKQRSLRRPRPCWRHLSKPGVNIAYNTRPYVFARLRLPPQLPETV